MDWGEIILTLVLDLILTVFFYLLVPVIFCIRKKPMTQKQIKKVIIINGVCVCLLFVILSGRVTAAVFLWSWVAKKIMERVLLVDDESDESKEIKQPEKTPSVAEQSKSEDFPPSQMTNSSIAVDKSIKKQHKAPDVNTKKNVPLWIAIVTMAVIIIGLITSIFIIATNKGENVSNEEPKTSNEVREIIYDWLVDNGKLESQSLLQYSEPRGTNGKYNVYMYGSDAKYQFAEIEFSRYLFNGKNYYLSAQLNITTCDDETADFIVSLQSYNNNAYCTIKYSVNLEKFRNNVPIDKEDVSCSNDAPSFSSLYTEAEKKESLTFVDEIDKVSYDLLLDLLEWIRDDFCVDTSLTMKDLGYKSYR